jgi:hypothetical protein
MDFKDRDIDLSLHGERRVVRVKADLLLLLWGSETGAQNEEGIVLANLGLIRRLAEMKGRSSSADIIEIGEDDYEGGEEGPEPGELNGP